MRKERRTRKIPPATRADDGKGPQLAGAIASIGVPEPLLLGELSRLRRCVKMEENIPLRIGQPKMNLRPAKKNYRIPVVYSLCALVSFSTIVRRAL